MEKPLIKINEVFSEGGYNSLTFNRIPVSKVFSTLSSLCLCFQVPTILCFCLECFQSLYVKWKSLSHIQLCDPMDYTVHGILQAWILEWVAFPFSKGSSQARDWTQVSLSAGRFFTNWATREVQEYWSGKPIPSPGDLPNPAIELGSPALQEDSLPIELPGKPSDLVRTNTN